MNVEPQEEMSLEDQQLDAALSGLATDDLDGARREALRRAAHEALSEAQTRPTALRRAEPLLVAAVVLLHLSWALVTAYGLLSP